MVQAAKEYAPYAKQLLALAQEAKVPNFEVVEEGVSGEMVVPTMVERALMVLGAAEAAGNPYTHIIVEGGFNDISFGRKSDDIFGGLLHIYMHGAKAGAHVVMLTLYEYNVSHPVLSRHEEVRHGLNVLIRDHVHSYGAAGKLSLVDVDKHIKRTTKPKSGGDSYYSDALHLTAEGYAYMGQLVWDEVFKRDLGTQR